MLVKSSKIIRNYVLREIVGTTVLSTLVLTAILLYGNLSKHDEDLFRALSISPLLFLELISLMLPFALSLGLPFGFSLAVIFCVGRWSADREILAMQSLGMKRSFWVRPILIFSFIVSLIACIASLQWSPISRGTFENRIKDMAWEDFQSWIDSGREINFKMNEDGGSNLIGGLDSSLQQKMTHASLTIGDGNFNVWKNIRILLWGGPELLAVLHAKNSSVSKDREQGTIELFLYDVDYESLQKKIAGHEKRSSFVSFDRWKQPLKFSIDAPVKTREIKRLPLLKFFEIIESEDLSDQEYIIASSHFNKYSSISCSPISLSPLLICFAIRRGLRETYANLFL